MIGVRKKCVAKCFKVEIVTSVLQLRPSPLMAHQPSFWPRAPFLLSLHDDTRLDTPHSVGLLWASDQLDAVTCA